MVGNILCLRAFILLNAWIMASKALIPSHGEAAYVNSLLKLQYCMRCLAEELSLKQTNGKSGDKTSIDSCGMTHEGNINILVKSGIDEVNLPSTSFFGLESQLNINCDIPVFQRVSQFQLGRDLLQAMLLTPTPPPRRK